MPPPASELDAALTSLLRTALPALFAGARPPVGLRVASDATEIVALESERAVTAARPTDQVDVLAFTATAPQGPYRLTVPPYPGPRRVRLVSAAGTVGLTDAEVVWDHVDPQALTLNLRPTRDLTGVTGVQVLYGVPAVFSTVAVRRTIGLFIETQDADVARLPGAVALALAVIELNRDALGAAAAVAYSGGGYGSGAHVKRLRLVSVTAPRNNSRLLTLDADMTLTLSRALTDAVPIQHIRTPGLVPDPQRPVQIDFEVSA